MKKIIFITFLFLFGFNSILAQHSKNHEKFKAHKVAYITQKLDLTPTEAEKFWPIYNIYEKNVYKYKVLKNREVKKQINSGGGIDALSKKVVSRHVSTLLQNEEEFIILKRKFYTDLKNVIPPKKILKLYHAENGFNRKILSELRKQRHRP